MKRAESRQLAYYGSSIKNHFWDNCRIMLWNCLTGLCNPPRRLFAASCAIAHALGGPATSLDVISALPSNGAEHLPSACDHQTIAVSIHLTGSRFSEPDYADQRLALLRRYVRFSPRNGS